MGSIGDHGLEGGCLLNHGGQFFLGGDAAAEVTLGVDFHQTCVEIVGTAVTEFLNGIHAGSLEKFGELRTYAFDAEEIGVVGPTENEESCSARGVVQRCLLRQRQAWRRIARLRLQCQLHGRS